MAKKKTGKELDGASRDQYREMLTSIVDEAKTGRYTIAEDKPDILFVMPAERWFTAKADSYSSDKITLLRYESLMLIECVWTCDVTGNPGEKIWEPADVEFLESDDHQLNGWLRKLKTAFAEFMAMTSEEATEKK